MKKVRILLRVSSNQQLEADGDLTVQRQLVLDYVNSKPEWKLDQKEYFEGSNSGYKNSVSDRDILQEILKDAQKKEFDILVAYKDDRVGRRMWEIGAYVMDLKRYDVDIYTVKDGCISPNSDDIMGQMVLALRYGNAQKSSSDTGMRVKDTAQKLVQKGKFMGGKAPYGYELVYSGEISKHGRVLKKLQIVEQQSKVVKHIYYLSYNKEFGSAKIAKILNTDSKYNTIAPNDNWKSGTITSILTNPVYAGYVAYKRREKIDGKYHTLDNEEWIKAENVNNDIQIIEEDLWSSVQNKRQLRGKKYTKALINKDVNIIKSNTGELPLIDVAYCGYCGCKLTNGTKYNYWTIKYTGERRASKVGIYKCQNAWSGIPHDKIKQFKADDVEEIVYKEVQKYISEHQKNNSILDEITKSTEEDNKDIKEEIKLLNQSITKIQNGINVMELHIPEAMTGEYALSIGELAKAIRTSKENLSEEQSSLDKLNNKLEENKSSKEKIKEMNNFIVTWDDVFNNADPCTKRVMINKIVHKISIKKDEINITYRFKLDNF